jgi:hypothetical protein
MSSKRTFEGELVVDDDAGVCVFFETGTGRRMTLDDLAPDSMDRGRVFGARITMEILSVGTEDDPNLPALEDMYPSTPGGDEP